MTNLPDSNSLELLLWVLRLRRRVGVTGASMLPGLAAGDEILVNKRAYRQTHPQVNDLVVARRPDRPEIEIVKRITAVTENGRYFLSGDNPTASTDSRHFGAVATSDILGKVTSKFG